jgi:hypothetical protein
MTEIIPTAAEAKELADDCLQAIKGMFEDPPTIYTGRAKITDQILLEMNKQLLQSWAGTNVDIKAYLGINSINWCMRFLRSHGHFDEAKRIEEALSAADLLKDED